MSSDASFYSWLCAFTLLIHGSRRALKSPRPGSAAAIPAGRLMMELAACEARRVGLPQREAKGKSSDV